MILEQFSVWAATASVPERAKGVRMLVQAFLLDRLGAKRADAVSLLTSFVDDPSPLVRRALAESLAQSAHAPRNIIVSLADDQSDVAAVVLEYSPILRDSDLIDIAASRDGQAQAAIAARPNLSEPVAAALAEVAELAAILVLLGNGVVKLPAFSLLRLIERFGDDGNLREAILKRGDLPSIVHVELVGATTRALTALVTGRDWLKQERMNKIATEMRDRATVAISAMQRSPSHDLVSYLRQKGQLTTALVLRAVLSGNTDLFRAILAELADLDEARVDSLIRNPKSNGFAAAYRRTDMPQDLLAVFRCALRATQNIEADSQSGLNLPAVERLLSTFANWDKGDMAGVMVLLRRFEAEAARDCARKAFAVADHKHAFDADIAAEILPIAAAKTEAEHAPTMVVQPAEQIEPVPVPVLAQAEASSAPAIVEAVAAELADGDETATIANPEPLQIEPEQELPESCLVEAALATLAEDMGQLLGAEQTERSSTVDHSLTQRRKPSYVVDMAALEVELMAA